MSFNVVLSHRYADYQNDTVYQNPCEKFWKSEATCLRVLASPVMYSLGIVGYALALPIRIAEVVKETFLLIGSLILAPCLGTKSLITHSIVFIFSLAELGSALLGLICPPLAYKIDAYFQSFDVFAQNTCGLSWENHDVSYADVFSTQTKIEKTRGEVVEQHRQKVAPSRLKNEPTTVQEIDEPSPYANTVVFGKQGNSFIAVTNRDINRRIGRIFDLQYTPPSIASVAENYKELIDDLALMQKKLSIYYVVDYSTIYTETINTLISSTLMIWVNKFLLGEEIKFVDFSGPIDLETDKNILESQKKAIYDAHKRTMEQMGNRFASLVNLWKSILKTSGLNKEEFCDFVLHKIAQKTLGYGSNVEEWTDSKRNLGAEETQSLEDHIHEIEEKLSQKQLLEDMDLFVKNCVELANYLTNNCSTKALSKLVHCALQKL